MEDIKTLYKKKMAIAKGKLGDTNQTELVGKPTKSITDELMNPKKSTSAAKSNKSNKSNKTNKQVNPEKHINKEIKIGSKSSKIKELLQRQVCHEFENERLYISMSLWCEENGYTETALFFSNHSIEERDHGMDFINYMAKRKMRIEPPCDVKIQRDFDDMKSLLNAALAQEFKTTTMIKEIHQEALKTSDLAITIASEYLHEQLEEEQLFTSVINLYNLCNGSKIDFEMVINKIKDKNKYKLGSL